MNFVKIFFLITISQYLISCTSYEQFKSYSQYLEIPTRVFKATYVQTWQATIQSLKKYELILTNQETGIIKTQWKDNTLALNFSDSFGGKDAIKAAKFKLIVTLSKGYKNEQEVTKVSVYKRQMVEQDFLQGWKIIQSDNILEDTILYRIERLLIMDNALQIIEQAKIKEAEKNL